MAELAAVGALLSASGGIGGASALGTAALGAAAGGLGAMSANKGGTLTSPEAPPSAPKPQEQPSTAAPKPKSNRPSFFDSSATPSVGQFGNKTLLGQ